MLMGTTILASSLFTGQVFASTTSNTNNLIEKNHFGGDSSVEVSNPVAPNVLNTENLAQKKTVVPLVKSVTPAMGATFVRPDANVVIQLDPTSKEYHLALAMLKNGLVKAYVLDGKSVTALPKSDLTFDATTNQVTISHDVFKRYTQQAIVLTAGGKDMQNHQDNGDKGKSSIALPVMDVVTAVDDTAQTVTLLNGGVISFASLDKEVKGIQMQSEQTDWQQGEKETVLEKAKSTFKLSTLFQVGNVVDTKTNTFDNKIHIVMKNPIGISTLFTTGSAIGEATHVSGNVDNASVRVTEGGKLNVNVSDDYGNPATNATLTVTGTGAGNTKVASAFATPDIVTITNGTGNAPLADHSAETVSLSYTVQDNTYKDAVDTQTGSLSEIFLPGQTAQLKVTNPPSVVAGQVATFKGVAEDIYGNNVMDGTQIKETAQNGTVSNASNTTNGDFTFDFQGTKAGANSISVVGADSGFSINNAFSVVHDSASKATINLPSSLTVGQNATVSGTLVDKYGNPVDKQSLVFTGALTGSVTTGSDGTFSASLKVASSGNVSAAFGTTPIVLATPSGQAITTISATSATVPVAHSDYTIYTYATNSISFNGSAGIQGYLYGLNFTPKGGAIVNITDGTRTFQVTTRSDGYFYLSWRPNQRGTFTITASYGGASYSRTITVN
ncbi:hypothetical protein PP175_27660 (plasmid) [Aneurinibacillus sp. Ricciae_BoGa-3]|uniref:hypothetical protein n=1 Tax=Aneurinibacillus sp. Ricciae_BoGa-3 TaxID=3022697 RepID=UPI002341F41A|nr:hypothetical protein [Aneurinibacillus sp. Ricciae_BoGa-3]WCK56971.1 hypothetical protein PP175_27660 [Aneurinibacillus sp. Ricciae_BoGa-3]